MPSGGHDENVEEWHIVSVVNEWRVNEKCMESGVPSGGKWEEPSHREKNGDQCTSQDEDQPVLQVNRFAMKKGMWKAYPNVACDFSTCSKVSIVLYSNLYTISDTRHVVFKSSVELIVIFGVNPMLESASWYDPFGDG